MLIDIPEVTPEIEAEAHLNPGGWVYKIDWPYKPEEHVPPETIVGGFEVSKDGKLTGKFEHNPNYRPIKIAIRQPREYMIRSLAPHDANQWILETDPQFDHLFPEIPPEGLVGSWFVGSDGKYTGQFRPNPHYKGNIKT